MRSAVTSIFVDDQAAALSFYTETLGSMTNGDEPVGEHRWIAVVAPEASYGVELLLVAGSAVTFQRRDLSAG